MKTTISTGFAVWAILSIMIGIGYAAPIIIETSVNPSNGNTYHLLSESTWDEAEATAISLGGHLVSISDDTENDWVLHAFGENRNLWIGLNDADGTGWHWSDGSAVTYLNFWDLSHGYPYEPYAAMTPDFSGNYLGQWDDWDGTTPWPVNNEPIFGVVESAAIPEPSTILLLGIGLAGLTSVLIRKK